jgi:hypothetical protein
VLDAHRHVVARAHPSDGRFSFGLAPGSYTVVAGANGYVVGRVSVRAVGGRASHANITNHNVR